eukprot:TRINITY_DN610_c0_g1_i2.p1 TRINITY_DN610_c0_g1~~TRINITY_DN610_c0_g1_i2.p1  ORF type:complete len:662 (+),score=154.88 TRINITY_DN610_c0_g1_i2:123-1988(+)
MEASHVFGLADRIVRCMVEVLSSKRILEPCKDAILLLKSLQQKMWENDTSHALMQLEGIGEKTCESLSSAGVRTFGDILRTEAARLDAICHRNHPFGRRLKEIVGSLRLFDFRIKQDSRRGEPKDHISFRVEVFQSNTDSTSSVRRSALPTTSTERSEGEEEGKVQTKKKAQRETWHLLVGIEPVVSSSTEKKGLLVLQKRLRSDFIHEGGTEIPVDVSLDDSFWAQFEHHDILPSQVHIHCHLISQTWMGFDVSKSFPIRLDQSLSSLRQTKIDLDDHCARTDGKVGDGLHHHQKMNETVSSKKPTSRSRIAPQTSSGQQTTRTMSKAPQQDLMAMKPSSVEDLSDAEIFELFDDVSKEYEVQLDPSSHLPATNSGASQDVQILSKENIMKTNIADLQTAVTEDIKRSLHSFGSLGQQEDSSPDTVTQWKERVRAALQTTASPSSKGKHHLVDYPAPDDSMCKLEDMLVSRNPLPSFKSPPSIQQPTPMEVFPTKHRVTATSHWRDIDHMDKLQHPSPLKREEIDLISNPVLYSGETHPTQKFTQSRKDKEYGRERVTEEPFVLSKHFEVPKLSFSIEAAAKFMELRKRASQLTGDKHGRSPSVSTVRKEKKTKLSLFPE